MIRHRVISIFLLSLMLAVNWHNSLFHTHGILDAEEEIHSHDHEHHHANHDSQGESGFFGWIKHLLGDFEHPDLGDNHLESFIQAQNQLGQVQIPTIVVFDFTFGQKYLSFSESKILQQRTLAEGVVSFADPPYLETLSTRGPPLFS